jgi:hypothetical protein
MTVAANANAITKCFIVSRLLVQWKRALQGAKAAYMTDCIDSTSQHHVVGIDL